MGGGDSVFGLLVRRFFFSFHLIPSLDSHTLCFRFDNASRLISRISFLVSF
jgi:hypothetical protein